MKSLRGNICYVRANWYCVAGTNAKLIGTNMFARSNKQFKATDHHDAVAQRYSLFRLFLHSSLALFPLIKIKKLR